TTASSNTITMTVNPLLTPTVSITANPGSTICSGTSVTFTAIPLNGGTTPAYQWKKNGTNVGFNSSSYTDAALANGDTIQCILTSNATCASPTTANSAIATVTVNAIATASAGGNQTVCASSPTVTLAGTVGGGATGGTWNGGTGSFTPNANTLNA